MACANTALGSERTHPTFKEETMNTIRTITLALSALIGASALSACNTVEGAGKDIKAGGEAIEREADKANK